MTTGDKSSRVAGANPGWDFPLVSAFKYSNKHGKNAKINQKSNAGTNLFAEYLNP
jgi:hypothetical protein